MFIKRFGLNYCGRALLRLSSVNTPIFWTLIDDLLTSSCFYELGMLKHSVFLARYRACFWENLSL